MRKLIIIGIVFLSFSSCLLGQDVDYKYRRSSLDVVFTTNFNYNSGINDVLLDVMKNYSLPDKYNDHSVGTRIVDMSYYAVSDAEVAELFPKLKLQLFMQQLSLQNGTRDPFRDMRIEEERLAARIFNYMEKNNIPDQLVSKWFNLGTRKIDGSYFNLDLIQERGAYNASELERLRSVESVRGNSILNDAGMELIPNTFILFVALEMTTSQEELARAQNSASTLGLNLLSNAYEEINRTNEGYYVVARTFLYQLNWTEQDSERFFSEFWETDTPQQLFSQKGLFSVNYLGCERSLSQVVERKGAYSREKLIERAANRAIDQAIVQLQKKYEVFKVKAPIIDVEKEYVSAFIGLKEGVEQNSKFEVLEKKYNDKNNTFRYSKVGTLKVAKGKICDNRYNVNGMPKVLDDEEEIVKGVDYNLDRTFFIGNTSNLASGMLIRQIK